METEVVNSQLIDYAAIFVQFVVAAGFVLTTIYFAQKIGPKH